MTGHTDKLILQDYFKTYKQWYFKGVMHTIKKIFKIRLIHSYDIIMVKAFYNIYKHVGF